MWGSSPSSHAERRGGNPGEKRALKKAPLFKRWLKGEDRKKEGIDPIVPYPPPLKKRGLHPSSKSPPIPPLAVWVALDRGRVCLAIGTPLFPSPKKSCLEKKNRKGRRKNPSPFLPCQKLLAGNLASSSSLLRPCWSSPLGVPLLFLRPGGLFNPPPPSRSVRPSFPSWRDAATATPRQRERFAQGVELAANSEARLSS